MNGWMDMDSCADPCADPGFLSGWRGPDPTARIQDPHMGQIHTNTRTHTHTHIPGPFPAILGKGPWQKLEKKIDLTSKLGEINDIEHYKGSKIYP